MKAVLFGPIPPADFEGDGCTGVPDTIHGVDVSRACRWHDWHYHLGTPKQGTSAYVSRAQADWWFYRNTYLLLREGGLWMPYAMLRALLRQIGVRWFGAWSGFMRIVAVVGTLAVVAGLAYLLLR